MLRVLAVFMLAIPAAACNVLASEPSEQELDAAVRAHFDSVTGGGTISNPINNVHMTLREVRKIGCEPANAGPGYFCTYTTRVSLGASSNETNQDGIDHATAADAILKVFAGGDYGLVDQNTHRFVKSWSGWELVNDGGEE